MARSTLLKPTTRDVGKRREIRDCDGKRHAPVNARSNDLRVDLNTSLGSLYSSGQKTAQCVADK